MTVHCSLATRAHASFDGTFQPPDYDCIRGGKHIIIKCQLFLSLNLSYFISALTWMEFIVFSETRMCFGKKKA